MSDENPNEFIAVHNPTTGGVAEVTRFGYENLWKEKGWVPLEESAELEKATREQLSTIARQRGVDVSKAKNKGEMVKAIKEGAAGAGNDQ